LYNSRRYEESSQETEGKKEMPKIKYHRRGAKYAEILKGKKQLLLLSLR